MSSIFYIIGSTLLLHAGYSSFEFHSLIKARHDNLALPTDIILEVICGILILIAGSINSTKNTPFLSASGKLINPTDTHLKNIDFRKATNEFQQIEVNPYEDLDSRLEFINVKEKRAEYKKWVQNETDKIELI
ncbi:ER membrane protein complex subunit 5 [[Candida] anglica]|uniref:ER membrane protein complex subunit 5 n=1 Tax=[Candida] anglica TaxID=148631 RepID=A0ABP0E8F9_9ASCO